MIKIITLLSIVLIPVFSYSITKESIINNYVETKNILSLNELEHVKSHIGRPDGRNKELYKCKTTGRLWMIDTNFDSTVARHYIFGDLYRLVLGERSPELRLIIDDNGQLMLGSQFIPDFKDLTQFFFRSMDSREAILQGLNKLKNCFPHSCNSISITGGEEVLVLMMLLGDIDGNCSNIGLIPNKDEEGSFTVAKIDHDEAGYGFLYGITLRSMAKIVFGEGKSYFTDFDYEKFDLNKMADVLDVIADLPDEIWGQTILRRFQELSAAGFNDPTVWPKVAQLCNERKGRCRGYALGLRCEAAVRANDFSAIQKLIASGFNPNTPIDYIHIDSVKEKQVASLVKLSSAESKEARNYLVKYAQQNGPIPILELAVRYKKLPLVKSLTPLSNAQAREKALKAAIEVGAKKCEAYIRNYKPSKQNAEL